MPVPSEQTLLSAQTSTANEPDAAAQRVSSVVFVDPAPPPKELQRTKGVYSSFNYIFVDNNYYTPGLPP